MEQKRDKNAQLSLPDFSFETAACARHGGLVAGVDEAGRGPWAGPVVAAAVILDPDFMPCGLNDSKKLKEAERDVLFDALQQQALVGIGIADVKRIDQDNILQASLWAMAEAVKALPKAPNVVLVDGNKLPALPMAMEAIVKGDGRSLSIAAASIVAKVTRDRVMRELSEVYPQYHWGQNKGYGTKLHQKALARHGVSLHHRRSFKPIRLLLDGET